MKNTLLFLFTFLVFCNTHIFSQFNGFEWLNPKPQGNQLNDIGFFNSTDGIAIGNYGTLLKTTNAGVSWEHYFLEAPKNLTSLDIVDANTAFIAGDNGLVLKSTNAGSSWITLNTQCDTNLTGIKFYDQNNGYAVGFFGTIIKTTNGGSSWTKNAFYYHNKDVDIIDSNNVFVVGDANTVIRTTNAGVNWFSVILSPSTECASITFTNSTTGYIVGGYYSNGRVYRTTDAGENWTNIYSDSSLGLLGVFFKDANTGFSVGYNGTIRKTTDAGNSWTTVSVDTKADLFDGYFINSNMGFIIGSGGKILRTSDGGDNWSEISQGNENFLYDIDIVNHNLAIAVGHYGTILKSTDGGITWQDKSITLASNPAIYDVEMLSASYGLAVDWNGNIHITNDGGDTWNSYSGFTFYSLNRLDFVDNNIGYAAGSFGKLGKTTDAGLTWTPLNAGNTESYFGIDFINSQTGYMCGSSGLIYKTTDAGNSWTSYNTNFPYYLRDISFSDSLNGVVVGDFSVIYKTSNGGSTWDSVYSVPFGATLQSLKRISSNVIYACGDSGKVLYSLDRGNSWNKQQSNTDNFLFGFAQIDTTLYIVGEAGTIIKFSNSIIPVELSSFSANVDNENDVTLNWCTATETNNHAFQIERRKTQKEKSTDWNKIGLINGYGTTTEPQTYSFVDKNLEAGHYQYRLKQIDFDGTNKYSNIVEVEIGTPIKFSLEQNFPNPFNPTTKISWQSPIEGNQTLKVYDVLGNEVATLVNEYRQAGEYDIDFNASQLASGVYFYKLQVSNFISTKKMTLIK
jgi:photosystem II stability/assembly factor-like uncharacterized protein